MTPGPRRRGVAVVLIQPGGPERDVARQRSEIQGQLTGFDRDREAFSVAGDAGEVVSVFRINIEPDGPGLAQGPRGELLSAGGIGAENRVVIFVLEGDAAHDPK